MGELYNAHHIWGKCVSCTWLTQCGLVFRCTEVVLWDIASISEFVLPIKLDFLLLCSVTVFLCSWLTSCHCLIICMLQNIWSSSFFLGIRKVYQLGGFVCMTWLCILSLKLKEDHFAERWPFEHRQYIASWSKLDCWQTCCVRNGVSVLFLLFRGYSGNIYVLIILEIFYVNLLIVYA